MAVLYSFPGGTDGQTAFTAATKVTGAGQSVAYDLNSTLAGQPGDAVFGLVNTNANYLQVSIAPQTTRIRSRFYADPSGLTFGANESYNINYFRGTSFTNRTHRMYWGNVTSTFGVIPLSYAEGSTSIVSQFIAVAKAEMWIEEEFVRSSALAATDAVYTVWVNDTQVYQRTGFTNYDSFALVNQIWFGGSAEIDAGTSGSFPMGKMLVTNEATSIGPVVLGAWRSTTLSHSLGVHF